MLKFQLQPQFCSSRWHFLSIMVQQVLLFHFPRVRTQVGPYGVRDVTVVSLSVTGDVVSVCEDCEEVAAQLALAVAAAARRQPLSVT